MKMKMKIHIKYREIQNKQCFGNENRRALE